MERADRGRGERVRKRGGREEISILIKKTDVRYLDIFIGRVTVRDRKTREIIEWQKETSDTLGPQKIVDILQLEGNRSGEHREGGPEEEEGRGQWPLATIILLGELPFRMKWTYTREEGLELFREDFRSLVEDKKVPNWKNQSKVMGGVWVSRLPGGVIF